MRYACVYLVISTTDQAKAVGELTQHVGETTSEVGEQEVGETTVGPTEHTEGACICLTSALIGELSELRDNLTLMFAIQCFFFHAWPTVFIPFLVLGLPLLHRYLTASL